MRCRTYWKDNVRVGLILGWLTRAYFRYFKYPLGQGTCLIKDQGAGGSQSFQIVTSLDQDAYRTGTTDAAKEGQRDADQQSSVTTDN